MRLELNHLGRKPFPSYCAIENSSAFMDIELQVKLQLGIIKTFSKLKLSYYYYYMLTHREPFLNCKMVESFLSRAILC